MKYLICIFFISFQLTAFSQSFYRISADFSIKSTQTDSSIQLVMGTVFYDINEKQIIYDIIFPKKETLVLEDSITYKFTDGELLEKYKTPDIIETTIFHLSLNGQLSNYGLKQSKFIINKVENSGTQIITTWLPPDEYKNAIDKILISTKENQMSGIIFFSDKDKIISKHFFNNYKNYEGLQFPSEVLVIKYFDNIEIYEKTTFKNIKINNYEENNNYHFDIPPN